MQLYVNVVLLTKPAHLEVLHKDLNVQKEATLTITDCTFLKNVYTKTAKKGLLYIQTNTGFTIKFTVTGNYIDLTDKPSAFTFIDFQIPSQMFSKFAFHDNKILPYESSKFISNINGYKFDLYGEGNAPYQPPIEPEYTIKDHKETDEIKNKKEYIGSTEKRVSVLVEQSTFKSFSSEKDGGLFKLKDIEVDFHDNKISNCEAVGGAGGEMLTTESALKTFNSLTAKLIMVALFMSTRHRVTATFLLASATSVQTQLLQKEEEARSTSVQTKER